MSRVRQTNLFRMTAILVAIWVASGSEAIAGTDPIAGASWYETHWVQASCSLAAVLLCYWLHRTRVAHLTARVRAEMQGRLLERERVSRELHDALLQGIHGLIWRFQSLVEKMRDDDPVRKGMDDALEHADRLLVEGRDRVLNLRAAVRVSGRLTDQLRELGNELAREHLVDFRATSHGVERELTMVAMDEICRISAEALLNACRHAKARRINLDLYFDPTELHVRLCDDGLGIDQSFIDQGRPGHWGLSAMRERARNIGGHLTVSNGLSGGVVVEMRVSGRAVYKNP